MKLCMSKVQFAGSKFLSKEGEWVLQNEQIHVQKGMRREIEMY
jgi:hypothetical protein